MLCILPFIGIIDAGNLGNNNFIAACDLFTFQSEESEQGSLVTHCFVDFVNKYQGSFANSCPVLIRQVPDRIPMLSKGELTVGRTFLIANILGLHS